MSGAGRTSSDYLRLFSRKSILVVEDEYFLADETRRRLELLGARIVGPTGNIRCAVDLIRVETVDAAILDIHIEGGLVFPVAYELVERRIPFVFATSFDPVVIPRDITGYSLCEKPIELADIARALFTHQVFDNRQ